MSRAGSGVRDHASPFLELRRVDRAACETLRQEFQGGGCGSGFVLVRGTALATTLGAIAIALAAAFIVDTCSPAAVSAIDPEQAQIDHAPKGPAANRAHFEVGNAEALPFADGTFDIVVSGLVLNFILDGDRALSEMRRVARKGGTIGGYVWDFAAELSPTWPLRLGLRELGKAIDSNKDGKLALEEMQAFMHATRK